jgi:hypothetical protein
MRGEEVGSGVSANENSCPHHVTWSLNELWRYTEFYCQIEDLSVILIAVAHRYTSGCVEMKIIAESFWNFFRNFSRISHSLSVSAKSFAKRNIIFANIHSPVHMFFAKFFRKYTSIHLFRKSVSFAITCKDFTFWKYSHKNVAFYLNIGDNICLFWLNPKEKSTFSYFRKSFWRNFPRIFGNICVLFVYFRMCFRESVRRKFFITTLTPSFKSGT